MLIAEINPSLVAYTYLHLAGILPCIVVVLALVGFAFRYHADESPLPWGFAACVVLWYVWHPAVIEYGYSKLNDSLMTTSIATDIWSYLEDGHLQLMRVGTGMPIAVFTWLFCSRNGSGSYARYTVVLASSAILSFVICWMTGTVGYDGYTAGVLPGLTHGDVYDLGYRIPGLYHLRAEKLPSWGEMVGWIIWYVGLFGTRPSETNRVAPVA